MKIVGIDARLLVQTGVGVYLRNLLHYLQEFKTPELKFYVYLRSDDYNQIKIGQPNFIKKRADFRWHSINEQLGFLNRINSDNLDLMHFTYFSYPLLYSKPFIITIHDLIPFFYKTGQASTKSPLIYQFKHLVYKSLISNAIHRSTGIIVPSNAIKKQIVENFSKKVGKKITITYEGIDYLLKNLNQERKLKLKYKKPFLFYLGNFYPHKNLENLIRAFSKIDTKDIKLILVGPDDFFTQRVENLVRQLNQKDRILLHKKPTRKDTVFFYKNALALVHPSQAEGFGLTLAEAVYYQLPIIASDIPVFSEIFENSFIKFNPKNVKDIQTKILSFLNKKPKFNYGKILKKISFKKMAQNTLKLYLQVFKEKI